jgi:preprotein translocase subunit SecD
MKKYGTVILIAFIVILSIWLILPNNPGIHVASLAKEIKTKLGLDLVGGVRILLEADLPENQTITSESLNTAKQIVDNRVNGLGVSEAQVQTVGGRRIMVELPGLENPEQAVETLKSTGLLEFVDMSSITQQEALTLKDTTIKTDYQLSGSSTISSTATITDTTDLSGHVWTTALTGADLENAQVSTDKTGAYEVAITFTPDGSKKFAEYTNNHVGDVLAIVLDKKVINVPTINSKIEDGKAVVTGNFDYESANQLAVQLRYGALPVPLKIVESSTVGPTLGQDSLRKSLLAGGIGLSLVIIFMALYYRLPGVLADVALILYAIISYALFRLIPVTLTLPGLTGFVLSIGMAVDANILIFERLKEELHAGRTLRQAVDLGWSRAWPSIRDSNFSTLITCTILFWFGSTYGASIVKGFSLTLAIGVLVSLFTAIIVTRTILHLVLDNIKSTEHPKWFE